jgi:hypothetical protein
MPLTKNGSIVYLYGQLKFSICVVRNSLYSRLADELQAAM